MFRRLVLGLLALTLVPISAPAMDTGIPAPADPYCDFAQMHHDLHGMVRYCHTASDQFGALAVRAHGSSIWFWRALQASTLVQAALAERSLKVPSSTDFLTARALYLEVIHHRPSLAVVLDAQQAVADIDRILQN